MGRKVKKRSAAVICGLLLGIVGIGITAFVFRENNRCIHTSGQGFIGAWGKPYDLKGIAFTNDVYDNPSVPPKTHHTEESYRFLHEMGINTVRFYLNYGLFEEDGEPYRYKEEGFAWIDANLEWAKKNGIRLILNMHYPQGGYQSQAGGSLLWTEEENKKRLTALWKEIAVRYAGEPGILGYGLLNEPVVPQLASFEESIRPVQALMQNIIAEIRSVDPEHIIFVERVQGVIPAAGQTWEFPYQDGRNFLPVEDDNYAYELHFYSPVEFTHQGLAWYEAQNGGGRDICWGGEDAVYGRLDREYLRKQLTPYLKIAEERNVPLYIGEMGTSNASMENGLGGEIWLRDMIGLCREYSLGFTVHSFHEQNGFGLFVDPVGNTPVTVNQKMNEVIREALFTVNVASFFRPTLSFLMKRSDLDYIAFGIGNITDSLPPACGGRLH